MELPQFPHLTALLTDSASFPSVFPWRMKTHQTQSQPGYLKLQHLKASLCYRDYRNAKRLKVNEASIINHANKNNEFGTEDGDRNYRLLPHREKKVPRCYLSYLKALA